MEISTRLFFALFSTVSFGATGLSEPLPDTVTRSGCERPVFSTPATDLARASESSQFEGKVTVLIGSVSE